MSTQARSNTPCKLHRRGTRLLRTGRTKGTTTQRSHFSVGKRCVRNVLRWFAPVSAERRCLVLCPWARQWHVCQTDTQLGKRTRLPAAYSGTATGHRLQLPRTGTGIPNLPSTTILLSSKDKENIIIFSKMVAIGFSSGHYARCYSKDRMPDRHLEMQAD